MFGDGALQRDDKRTTECYGSEKDGSSWENDWPVNVHGEGTSVMSHKISINSTVIIIPELPSSMYSSSPVSKAQCARVSYASSLPFRVLAVTSSPRIYSLHLGIHS